MMTSPVVAEKHSPSPASEVAEPPAASPSLAAAAVAAVTTGETTDAGSKLDDLETELELDLENMKLDNIDTTVCSRRCSGAPCGAGAPLFPLVHLLPHPVSYTHLTLPTNREV